MRKLYGSSTCANCRQGRLLFQNDTTNERVYVHCEECEWGWLHPEGLGDVAQGFLTLLSDFESTDATLEDVQRSEWRDHIAGSFEEA
ncbi:hypothetical protein ACSFBM_02670 [Variovorax sp. GB1R11]|uniref:hypothetical protein n=1 Tax=Variovorax sp. GB1R11 TaxID=3443741 RepID=UPI003F489D1B